MSPPQSQSLSAKKTRLKDQAAEVKEKTLRGIYFDILEGYSSITIDGETAWIKHFDLKSQTQIDHYYDDIYKKAQDQGLMTRAELLDRLEKEGSWTPEEEEALQKLIKGLEGLRSTSAKALNARMEETINENIKRAEKEIAKHRKKKEALISDTCEQFAERRSSDMIIRLSFYKKDKSGPYFNSHDFDLLDREDIGKLIGIYNESTENLNTESIKQISVSDFFTSYYSLVEDNPGGFFDRPIHDLSFFQVNLLNYARLFVSILKNLDPPEHIRGNAEKLLAFAKSESKKRKAEDRKSKRDSGGPATL